jgi:hypothetical protein
VCPLHLWFRGTQSLAGEGVGESQFGRARRQTLNSVQCTDTEGVRGNRGEYRSQSWVENTNMTEKLAIHSDKQLPQSLFTGQFFR